MTVAAGAAKAAGAELLDYDEVVARFQPVLGLEVHVELSTATKMFCGCTTTFGGEPNTQVCPVCLGLPGSLPVLNRAAVESAIRIGLALNCEIVPWCRFARKNYFYPDMPKNYQISQYDEPIAINGYLDAPLEDGTTWRVEIERAHMEEDTGKLTHIGSETGRIHGATGSLIDYNRAGVPLIEIVTKPIVGAGARAPQIARSYVTALRDLLRALDVSDVRMDQGSMRCDANVSLKPAGTTEFGTRTETKNVNSLKSVEVAVRYEMQRQGAILASGGRITQETRHFHEAGYTSAGRTKETAEDYRYFPEPDLEPVAPSRELVERLRQTIPELPWLSRRRIQQEWGVSDEVMRDLVNAGAVELVAATVEHGASSEAARAWWGNFLAQKANEAGIGLDELAITPAQVAAVVALVDEGKLSNSLARQVVEGVLAGEGEPEQVMTARGLALVRDDSLTQAAVDEALAANPDVADKIRGGKVAAAGARALVVAILVFVLLGSFILPHTGSVRGWDVLFSSHGAGRAAVALPSRVFAWLALVFGVGFSMLALLTRRWALAWVALAGSAMASGTGLLAVWSRQTVAAGHPGPGIGLIVAWITAIVLTFHWAQVVWSRTIVQLAAEERRRRVVAQQQCKTLLDHVQTDSEAGTTPDRGTDR